MNNEKLNEINNMIEKLWKEYEENPYMLNKFHNYVVNLLPNNLETINEDYKQREERKKKLTKEKDEFTKTFLGTHNYFYCSSSEYFFSYDGLHYKIVNQDDIVYKILSTITKEQNLMAWKHKIKNNIMCLIREKSVLNAIPESQTIQNVIKYLYPNIFNSKNSTKYFLTILGDNILKKNDNLIYLISHQSHHFLKEISTNGFILLGNGNITNTFKFKYYDHNYKDCRLISINEFISGSSLSSDLQKNILDLICVATHYSKRYGSADSFLVNHCEESISEHALFLTNNNTQSIVESFISTSLQKVKIGCIDMKNMLFLWKKYLETQKIPNIIFHNPLKILLKKNLLYDEEKDVFIGVTSIHLPTVSKFLSFWNENICEENEDLEFEIGEIYSLFKHWIGNSKNHPITEEILLEYIRYFYPDILIEENKYILQINCKLWDKRSDVIDIINQFKDKCIQNNEQSFQTLYDIYSYYCENTFKHNNNLVVSKRYFEKIAFEYLNKYIEKENIISSTWFENKLL
jgi:hypothetical protein